MRVEVKPARALRGRVRVPGDKSISHRGALLGALSHGTTRIDGFLPSADCLATLDCLTRLGVKVRRIAADCVEVVGKGPEALGEPQDVLDCKNSGTSMRLLCGVVASRPLYAVMVGDSSLHKRPMARVI